MTPASRTAQGCRLHGRLERIAGGTPHRRAGAQNLRRWRGSGRVGAAAAGETDRRRAGRQGEVRPRFAGHPFRHEAALQQAGRQEQEEETGTPAGPSGQPTAGPRAGRREKRPPRRLLSRLRRAVERMLRNAHAIHRRHSRRHPPGHHRTHDPPRLVLPLPEEGRTAGARRLARFDVRASAAGARGLDALRTLATRFRRSSRCSTFICASKSRPAR